MPLSKIKVLSRIAESGLVAIVRSDSSDQAARIAEACAHGGAAAVEITFTVPGAAAVISDLANRYSSGEILLGAGTVLDPETARIAILAGAQYIISPSLNVDTARLCNRYQIPYMPGAGSVRDIVEAMEVWRGYHQSFPGGIARPGIRQGRQRPFAAGQSDADRRGGHRQCRELDPRGMRRSRCRRALNGQRQDGRFSSHHGPCQAIHRRHSRGSQAW